MSVKVNLLPEATRSRERQGQQRLVAIAVFGLLLVLLAVGYWYQLERVEDAELELAAADAAVAQREQELAELEPFAELEAAAMRSTEALVTALGEEISVAGVLQDLALVTPDDVALTEVDLIVTEEIATADGPVVRPAIARLVISGETTADHAPGLERMMREYDMMATMFNLHLTTTEIDDEQPDVLLFTIEADLGEEARTGRYLEGLPEELR